MINDLWYKNAVVYCLSIGTFMDTNGDGVGDFQGLMRRLDYLQGLGVTTIWLMPFHPSPQKDDGYDIADYYGVDPRYGTLGDFVEFTHGCEQRGMRVIIDLVVNHTSDQHPWFQRPAPTRSRPTATGTSGRTRSRARPTRAWCSRACRRSPGRYDRQAKAWYFHRFYDFQPDLNTSNPEVHAEILKIMGFWIQLGVAGFRMDAVPFVISEKGPDVTEPVRHYDMLRNFREFLQWRRGDAMILAEANVLPDTDLEYFGDDGDRMHMMFNFQVNQNLFYAMAAADTAPARQGAEGDQAAARHRAVGHLPAQSRRARPRPAHRRAARSRSSPPSAPTRRCSSTSAASAAGSRRCSTATAAGSSSPTA